MKVPQFYVRSSVHMTNLDSAINRLLVNESLIDVTLACDGHRFQCHRLVLAAASPLFEELLMEHPKDHPIVIIPIGVKWHILKSLIDFMYRGQTCINQAELKTLIESAELLQVIGLYDPQTQFREFYGDDDKMLEQKSEEEVDGNNEENEEEQELNHSNDTNQDHQQNHSQSQNQEEDQNQENSDENTNEEENNINKSLERIVDFIEIDDSQDTFQQVPTEDQHCTVPNDEATLTNDETHDINSIPLSNQNPRETITDDATEAEETECDVLQKVPNLPITGTIPIKTNETMPLIRVKPTIKLINLFKLNRPGQIDGNKSPSNVPWTYIHIPAPVGSNIQSPSTQVPLSNVAVPIPQWSVNSLPQLMPAVIAKSVQESNENTTVECAGIVPSFLKFNSSSMAISVKNLDRTKTREKLNVLNMALESESPEQQPIKQQESEGEDEDETKNYQDNADGCNQEQGSVESLRIKQEKEEIEVKTESMDFDSDEDNKSEQVVAEPEGDGAAEAESIICQPNVSYIYDGQQYETYGNNQHNSQKSKKKPMNKKLKTKAQLRSVTSTAAAAENCKVKSSCQSPASELTNSHNYLHQRLKDPPTLVPLSVMNAGLGPKHLYYHHKKNNNKKMEIDQKADNSLSKTLSEFEESATNVDLPDSHTQNSVILRNPRCNQPRHYSNESLYAALMAVKYGDSIYRASRLHQVPRKTLRNWMKRWDIKSQYPMPKQLKDAAKKKKLNQTQSD